MAAKTLHIVLADDDPDDCIFFKDVLDDLNIDTTVSIVNDGAELIYLLSQHQTLLPDVLFLDLNMPRKSGFECLTEIKSSARLKDIPVIILSTSLDQQVADLLYEKGALYYIRKPGDFPRLRKVIEHALKIIDKDINQPSKRNFILQS